MKPQTSQSAQEKNPTMVSGKLMVAEHLVSKTWGSVASNEHAPTTLQMEDASPHSRSARRLERNKMANS